MQVKRYTCLIILFFVFASHAPNVIAADDHGNDAASATLVNPESSTAGVIEIAGDTDFFRIDLLQSGELTLYSTGSIDTTGALTDSAGSPILYNDDGDVAGGNFQIIATGLLAGTYYVEVTEFDTNTGNYTFVSSFTPDVIPTEFTLSVNKSGSGKVLSDDGFISCDDTCVSDSAVYASGTSITLNPTPSTGYDFDNWSGACTGTASCVVTLTSSQSVTANFSFITTPDDHGNNTSTASVILPDSTTTGVIEIDGDDDYFKITLEEPGDLVLYTTGILDTRGALLDSTGSQIAFDDDSGAGSHFQIVKNDLVAGDYFVTVSAFTSNTGSYTLVSEFSPTAMPTNYILSLSKVGNGSVTSADGLIICDEACPSASESYAVDVSVSMSAIPASGYQFVGWSGGCSGTDDCLLNMTSNFSVTASFSLIPIVDDHGDDLANATTINVDSETPGVFEIIGDNDYFKIILLEPGDLELRTTGSLNTAGNFFDSLGNEIAFNNDTGNFQLSATGLVVGSYYLNVTELSNVTGNYSLISLFTSAVQPVSYFLSLGKTGAGSVISIDGSVNCDASCDSETVSYFTGAKVTLAAIPEAGYSFSGWQGACGGVNNCLVTFDGDQSVTANFSNDSVDVRPVATPESASDAGGISVGFIVIFLMMFAARKRACEIN